MSSELLYTSAPQGLKGGSRGFTTVLCTAGMPPNLADKLESFSGYKHVYSPQDPLAEHNPVRFAYLRPNVGGRSVAVVSRLAAYGVDYSGRSNKIAHHIVLEPNERPHGGPAWLLAQKDLWKAGWDGECKNVASGPRIPEGDKVAGVCRQWHEIAGDAGWGGQLVTWLKQSNKPIWLIYEPKQQGKVLELLGESFALLPEAERWKFTFATYFSGLPSDVDCRIRGVVTGSDEARLAPARGHVIDLTRPVLLSSVSAWIEAARTGVVESTEVAVSGAPELPLGSDAVLGLQEDSSLAAFISVESPWRDEPQRVSETSLPVDLPRGVGDYQLAPPPVPTTGRSPKPPTLPTQQNGRDSTLSIFRWALPAVAVLVLFMVLGVGFWAYRDFIARSLSLTKAGLTASHDEPSPSEIQSKMEVNADEESLHAVSEEIVSESNSASQEPPMKSPIPEISLVYEDEIQEIRQTWSEKSDSGFNVSINENCKDVTNYRLELPDNLIARIDPQDSFLMLNDEDKIVISKEQDYESNEWETNPKRLGIIIKGSEVETRISLDVQLTNMTGNVLARKITKRIDISKGDKELPFDVRKEYESALNEVEGFKFDLMHNGNASVEVEGKFGKISRKGEEFVYAVDVDRVFSANQLDSEEIFMYQVSCDGYQAASQESIIIQIYNPNRFNWLAAKTVDGSDLRFDKEVVKKLFESEGEYEVYFTQDNSPIGEPVVLNMIRQGGRLLLMSGKGLSSQGVGVFALDPSSKDKNKIEFVDSCILRKHIEALFIEFFLFQSMCEEQIKEELERKSKEIEGLKSLAQDDKNKFDERERLRIDKNSVESLRIRLTDIVKKRRGARDVRSIEDLLNQNVEVLLTQLIDEMEAKNTCAKDVLTRSRQATLNRFNQARDYIRSCQLIIEKKVGGSAAFERKGPGSSTEKVLPPLPSR